jgi:hypothetical protein
VAYGWNKDFRRVPAASCSMELDWNTMVAAPGGFEELGPQLGSAAGLPPSLNQLGRWPALCGQLTPHAGIVHNRTRGAKKAAPLSSSKAEEKGNVRAPYASSDRERGGTRPQSSKGLTCSICPHRGVCAVPDVCRSHRMRRWTRSIRWFAKPDGADSGS